MEDPHFLEINHASPNWEVGSQRDVFLPSFGLRPDLQLGCGLRSLSQKHGDVGATSSLTNHSALREQTPCVLTHGEECYCPGSLSSRAAIDGGDKPYIATLAICASYATLMLDVRTAWSLSSFSAASSCRPASSPPARTTSPSSATTNG